MKKSEKCFCGRKAVWKGMCEICVENYVYKDLFEAIHKKENGTALPRAEESV